MYALHKWFNDIYDRCAPLESLVKYIWEYYGRVPKIIYVSIWHVNVQVDSFDLIVVIF